MQNVVIGNPIVSPAELLAANDKDWLENERPNTLFTAERFLPRIMVECGIVPSVSEVRRNRKDLCIELNELDCFTVKWGKKFLHIVVGE